MKISIILPVLNEAGHIITTLERLQSFRQKGHEVIVVDGGSRDGTLELSHSLADSVLVSKKGRAIQMNAGADVSTGDVLLFLHADTWLPESAAESISVSMKTDRQWGRFNVRLSGNSWMFRLIERMMKECTLDGASSVAICILHRVENRLLG